VIDRRNRRNVMSFRLKEGIYRVKCREPGCPFNSEFVVKENIMGATEMDVDSEAFKIARNLGYIKHDSLYGRMHPLANPEVSKISGSYEHLGAGPESAAVHTETPPAAPVRTPPIPPAATPPTPPVWAPAAPPVVERPKPAAPIMPARPAVKIVVKKTAPPKKKPAAKKKPVARKKPAAKRKTVAKKKAVTKKKIVARKKPAAKKKTVAKRKPAARKKTVTKKRPAARKKAATKKRSRR
jgi:hypothetical protein